MRWSVRVRTRLVSTLRKVVDQALYLSDSDDPMDAVDWFLGMPGAGLGRASASAGLCGSLISAERTLLALR